MATRALDQNSDYSFGKGKSNYLKKSDEIKQNISTRINSWVGDCFFALDEGVDWNTYLENGNAKLLGEDIQRVIVQTYGVGRLESFSYSLEDRIFKAEYTIIDIYSNTWNDAIEGIQI